MLSKLIIKGVEFTYSKLNTGVKLSVDEEQHILFLSSGTTKEFDLLNTVFISELLLRFPGCSIINLGSLSTLEVFDERYHYIYCDFKSERSVDHALKKLFLHPLSTHFNMVINNVHEGIQTVYDRTIDFQDVAQIRDCLRANLTHIMIILKNVLQRGVRNEDPLYVVSMSSTITLDVKEYAIGYTSAKAGLAHFMDSLSSEVEKECKSFLVFLPYQLSTDDVPVLVDDLLKDFHHGRQGAKVCHLPTEVNRIHIRKDALKLLKEWM
ncbi:Srl4p KNAG_0A05800 [Huiozyma naganishii CBS 8797]|uniref:Ketoreductase (KR) domain-containing protein n=1 Tax=Huiozyma naganishii (strain ATCC MYA-139 / BCRC 22969 / CBS 8797 / KCTC 17520 / NBRC 10181 / NCYC 3082 / Yp74L-3) TaxID=1071383 RepID=J7RFA7_HUIN7|nr:hypothetical protein KNAG_0A05800 [Kazachstania naganishii CBS 8797]CCK68243.1 hypothetical protein KNAG_0A05800 [Kazachstania naganishii CBS 8797]